MFAPTRYLAWARRMHGRARFDLATSGIPTLVDHPLDPCDAPCSTAPLSCLDAGVPWLRLREAIAAYNDVPADEVVPALGTTHAVWLAYAAVMSPGDDLVVEDPG